MDDMCGGGSCPQGQAYTVRDDYWAHLLAGAPLSVAEQLLSLVYVRPKAWPSNANRIQPFVRNVSPLVLAASPRELTSSPAFWALTMIYMFDGPLLRDGDPDAEGSLMGLVVRVGPAIGAVDPYQMNVGIFAEGIRDASVAASYTPPVAPRVVAHELICHVLNNPVSPAPTDICYGVYQDGPTGVELSTTQKLHMRLLAAPEYEP
jgi:hypothetical protein